MHVLRNFEEEFGGPATFWAERYKPQSRRQPVYAIQLNSGWLWLGGRISLLRRRVCATDLARVALVAKNRKVCWQPWGAVWCAGSVSHV